MKTYNDLPEPHYEKTKRKRSWIEYVVSTLVVAVITGVVAMMANNYNSIQADYDKLRKLIYDMGATYEEVYRFCRVAVKKPDAPTEFQQWALLGFQREINQQITDYNNTRRALGELVSSKTNAQAHKLSCSMDRVNFLSVNACVLKISEAEIMTMRDQTFLAIREDKEKHQKFLQIFEDLLASYIDDPRNKGPEALPCQMPATLLKTKVENNNSKEKLSNYMGF